MSHPWFPISPFQGFFLTAWSRWAAPIAYISRPFRAD